MRYFFLDTSFILSLIEKGKDLVNLSQDYLNELLIPATSLSVIKELENLSKNKSYERKVNLAKQIISKYKIFEDDSQNADESLLELCKKYNGILATADIELLNRALEKGIAVMFLKHGRKLVYFES
ncbi:MAG: PIN domain-containing protein [Thermoproteota archaeon]|jgi:rRNA-processing protein FCF1|nr:PIN domain-containing protein [Thermoproteota archaeon]